MSVHYRNLNTGEVIERDQPSARLDALDNWERVDNADEARAEPPVSDGVLHRPGMATAKQTNGSATPTLVGEADVPERPADRAPKSEWTAYAVAQGADPGDAEDMTRAELIDRYGDEQP